MAYVLKATTIGLTRSAGNIKTPGSGLPAFVDGTQFQFTLAANQTADLRDVVFHQHPPKVSAFRPNNCGVNMVATGFKVVGQQSNDTVTWFEMKADVGQANVQGTGEVGLDYDDNGAFFSTSSAPGSLNIIENAVFYGCMDAINPDTAPKFGSVLVRSCYFAFIRDEIVEQDGGQAVELQDCLADCVHTITSGTGTGATFKARNCLLHCGRNPYTTEIGNNPNTGNSGFAGRYPNSTLIANQGSGFGYRCGKLFKFASGGLTVDIADCVLRMDSQSVGGTGSAMDFPPGTYSNVIFVWLGTGTYPRTIPTGVTVMTGSTGLAFWNEQRTAWLDVHDVIDVDAADFAFLHEEPEPVAGLGTPVGLTDGGSTSAGLSKSTASISPTAGRIVHAACVARKVTSGGAAGVLTISTAMGGSWSWGTPLFVTDTGGERDSLYVWQAEVPSGVTAGTVSFTSTVNSDVWNWIIWEVPGAALGFGTNHDEIFDSVGTTSFNLPGTPAASSQVYGVLASSGDANGVTVGSGYTVVTQSLIVPIGLNVQYDPAPADASVAWSGSTAPENLMIAWELTEAPGGTAMVVVVGI